MQEACCLARPFCFLSLLFLPVEHPNHFRCPPFYYTVRCWNVVVVPLYTILSFYFICTGQVNDAFHPSAVTGCTCSSVSVGQPLVKRSTNFFSFLFPASVRQSIDPFRAVFLFLQMKIPPMLRREIVLRPCSRSKWLPARISPFPGTSGVRVALSLTWSRRQCCRHDSTSLTQNLNLHPLSLYSWEIVGVSGVRTWFFSSSALCPFSWDFSFPFKRGEEEEEEKKKIRWGSPSVVLFPRLLLSRSPQKGKKKKSFPSFLSFVCYYTNTEREREEPQTEITSKRGGISLTQKKRREEKKFAVVIRLRTAPKRSLVSVDIGSDSSGAPVAVWNNKSIKKTSTHWMWPIPGLSIAGKGPRAKSRCIWWPLRWLAPVCVFVIG